MAHSPTHVQTPRIILAYAYPYGMTLVSRISGSFTDFTHGLPMEILIPLLRRSGIAVKP